MSSSSSSSISPPWDVFLSFYGRDTRNNFTTHLYYALDQAAIRTFRDDPELREGQNISSGLIKAIQDSKTSIVVLSQNYARSSWCLDELVEILACSKSKGLLIFPIFYHVNPSDVRRQRGGFAEALEIHKKRYSMDMIDKWRDALTELANISGYHVDGNRNESDTIQQIVEDVALRVSTRAVHIDGHLVGINSAVEEIYEKLSMQSDDVRAFGICGMGGIGKTTIAKAFYNKFYHKFQVSCFLVDVKDICERPHSEVSLLQQLLVQLLRARDYKVTNVENGIQKLKEILSSNKALLVLDNYAQTSYLDMLVSDYKLFAPGSRIMITTRDENLLNRLGIEIYKVMKWGEQESMELFSHHAFKSPSEDIEKENFSELSKDFVYYANGLPLALAVLGSSLRGRTVSYWKSTLEKVKRNPEKDIQKILKLSYDTLNDRTEKEIFLDIVFFFVGKDKDEASEVFDSCGFFPSTGITCLVERSLITVDWDNKFRMHSLILALGKEVIRDELRMPGTSRRLLCQGNAFESLEYQEGIDRIEGLIIDLNMSTQIHLSAKIFQRMTSLRLLEIINAPHDIKGSFENSLQQLRYFRWHYCPWENLPSSFQPHELVCLDMQFSKLTTLWEGQMPLINLKTINVRWSKLLTTTSDLSRVIELKKIWFTGCGNLRKVHDSIIHLRNLRHLDLQKCPKLKKLPALLGDMNGLEIINASYTDIQQLPESIGQLRKLNILMLVGCKKLKMLPEQLGNMEGLRMFDASESSIGQLPDSFVGLTNLVELKLRDCKNLRNLPNCIWKLSALILIDVSDCSNLDHLPKQLGKMQCLKELLASVEELPDSIGQLSTLEKLNLSGCEKLRDMPQGILNLSGCENLRDMPQGILNRMCKNLKYLSLLWNIRASMPTILCWSSLKLLCLSATKQWSLSELSRLEDLPRTSFPELPLSLEALTVENYESLEQLPDLSSLKQLKTLLIRKCISLGSLPRLPPNLWDLRIYSCTSLQDPPDLTSLKDLFYLEIIECGTVKLHVEESFIEEGVSLNFKGRLQSKKIPDWFSNKSNGSTVSCYVPPIARVDYIGMALWVVYDVKSFADNHFGAVITNKTNGSKQRVADFQRIYTLDDGQVGSAIICMNERNMVKLKCGDEIEVSFQDKNVQKCGVHFVYRPNFSFTSSTAYPENTACFLS